MKKETKLQLDSLMEKYEQKLAEAQKRQEQSKSKEDAFLNEFKRLQKDVIRPVMEDIGNQLKARGHHYRIDTEEKSVDSGGRSRDPKISIYIFPTGTNPIGYSPDRTPSVSFIATGYKKKIWVYGSDMMPNSGGSSGSIGEFNAEEITNDLVEKKILEVFKRVFDRKY